MRSLNGGKTLKRWRGKPPNPAVHRPIAGIVARVLIAEDEIGAVHHADNLDLSEQVADGAVDLVYIDPPFNTGKPSAALTLKTVRDEDGDRTGFGGQRYRTEHRASELRRHLRRLPRVPRAAPASTRIACSRRPAASTSTSTTARCTTARCCSIAIFGRDNFLNEIIWAYDYGGRPRDRWPAKHDNILFYAKDAGAAPVQHRRDRSHPVHGAGARRPREGGARQAADRHLVAHDRQPDRQGEARLPDAEAARRSCAASCRVVADRAASCSTSSPAAARPAPPR